MHHPFPRFNLIVPKHQKERLAKTCFRAEKKAGSFISWRSSEDLILDPEIYHPFNDEIEDILRSENFQDGTYSFTIKCSKPIGWSSTVPLAEVEGLVLETRQLNKRSSAQFVTDPRFKARLTNLVTFIVNFRDDKDHPGDLAVLLESIYPGPDVGNLKGDMTAKTGLVFLSWEQKGQSISRRNPDWTGQIAQIFQEFLDGPGGEVDGFVILANPGKTRNQELDDLSRLTYQYRMVWDWREWAPLLDNPPAHEYFLCFEGKQLSAVDSLMREIARILKQDGKSWRISFQQIGKVDDLRTNPDSIPIGECFSWALREQSQLSREGVEVDLVHAQVTHPYTGRTFWHAWIELADLVYDWQTVEVRRTQPLSTAEFYRIWQPNNIKRYSRLETIQHMLTTQHFGPWH